MDAAGLALMLFDAELIGSTVLFVLFLVVRLVGFIMVICGFYMLHYGGEKS